MRSGSKRELHSSFLPWLMLPGLCLQSFAGTNEVKFGPEFTFTNEAMLNADWSMPDGDALTDRPENIEALNRFSTEITKICAREGCTITNQSKALSDGWRSPQVKVTYPDGWWFIAGLDPVVIEFQAKEMTAQDMERLSSRIEDHIFGICARLGLFPRSGVGGGHIHMDLETAFGGDALLFRNFVVDFANHSALGRGPLSYDKGNAPSIASLPTDQKLAFRNVIADFDQGRSQRSIRHLAAAIERRVYFRSPKGKSPSEKYMALNLRRITNPKLPATERTIEIRAIRAQRTFNDFKALTRLLERRLKMLEGIEKPVEIGPLEVPQSLSARLTDFNEYVRGAGLDPADYAGILPSQFQDCSELLDR